MLAPYSYDLCQKAIEPVEREHNKVKIFGVTLVAILLLYY